jgi:hypothetical protein
MRSLLFAEVAEVLMHDQNNHWDCGASGGESLSRVLAADLCLGDRDLPPGWACAPAWLADRQNWIDKQEFTDTDQVANGCGVLFLNWLRFAHAKNWNQITIAGAPTLAQTFEKLQLGPANTAWPSFLAVINATFPPGHPVNVNRDNPFID